MNDRINIFEVLEKIDTVNIDYFQSMSQEQFKQVVPYVIMQWMACTKDKNQIVLLNEIVNKRIFSLHKHPKLLVYLLMACSDGSKKFYKWKKPSVKQLKFPKSVKVMKEATGYSTNRILEYMHVYSNEDILQYANELGYQQDELKDLSKELADR
jgi:hypothetical protein